MSGLAVLAELKRLNHSLRAIMQNKGRAISDPALLLPY